MKRKRSPAFQFYAAEFLADHNVLVMTSEEVGAYWLLICVCWREGSLPDDAEELAAIARLSLEAFRPSWQRRIQRCFAQRADGRWMHLRLEKEAKKQAMWRAKSVEGGIKSGASRRKVVKGGSDVVQPKSNSSSSSSSSAFAESSEKKRPPAPARPDDPLYVIFRDEYRKHYSVDVAIEYQHTKGDFVQLEALKKRQNGSLHTMWPRAVQNYLQTPQCLHTMAYLCTNFATFQKDALDRYGRPVDHRNVGGGGINGSTSQNNKGNRAHERPAPRARGVAPSKPTPAVGHNAGLSPMPERGVGDEYGSPREALPLSSAED